MGRVALSIVIAALAVLASAPAAWVRAGATQTAGIESGEQGGAEYLVEVPPAWNGGLVVFAHGYEGEGPGRGTARGEPLATHLRSRGYAWAASGYRSRGYRPDHFLEDTRALRAVFAARFGIPRWTIIHGQSMGGHVTMASLELHPGVYQGALVECGVVDGIGIGDFLYAYTAAAEYLSGVRLLDAPDRAAFGSLVATQWLPAMGTPGAYTARGRQFDSVVKYLMGGDLPLRTLAVGGRYLANLNPRDPSPQGSRDVARAASTAHVRYRIDPGLGVDEEEMNARIRRVLPEPGARSRETNPVFAELTGRITVPVLSIHETADLRVPFRLEQDYRRRALAAGTAHLLVQRAVRWPGHCAFDGVVRERAFDDLVLWIERGVVPAGDDVLAADVSTLGLRWTPALHPDDPARR